MGVTGSRCEGHTQVVGSLIQVSTYIYKQRTNYPVFAFRGSIGLALQVVFPRFLPWYIVVADQTKPDKYWRVMSHA